MFVVKEGYFIVSLTTLLISEPLLIKRPAIFKTPQYCRPPATANLVVYFVKEKGKPWLFNLQSATNLNERQPYSTTPRSSPVCIKNASILLNSWTIPRIHHGTETLAQTNGCISNKQSVYMLSI